MLIGLFALATLACRPAAAPTPSAPSPLYESALPDFKRPTIAGAAIDTQALRGKVVVVKFFAKYCEPCKKTLPEAEALHQKHGDAIAIIGVSEDEYAADVQAIVAAYGLSFPVVHDRGNVLAGRFRVTEIPITFVADPEGRVRWIGGPDMAVGDLGRAIAAFR